MKVPKTISFFFLAGWALGSLYIFPSGLPQPTDFILAVWILIVFGFLLSRKIPCTKSDRKIFIPLLLLIAWIVIVSISNAVYFDIPEIAFPALFYIYNASFFLAYMSCAILFGEHWRKITLDALFYAAMLMLLLYAKNFDIHSSRQLAGFNNPNQLGYYSLLLFCSFTVIARREEVSSARGLFIIIFSTIGVLSTASLAATGALVLAYIGFYLHYFKLKNLKYILVSAPVIVLVLFSISYFTQVDNYILNAWDARLNVLERKMEQVEVERGYNRIVEFPEYIIFGAGERGHFERFGLGHTHEIHSSLGTLLFCYGILGLLLFSIIYIRAFYSGPFFLLLIAAAPIVYSLTHQGLRTTAFWLLIALLYFYWSRKDTKSMQNINK